MMEEKLPTGWVQSKVSGFMCEVKEKVNPIEINETIYIGLEHFGSARGVISFGSSKEVKSLKTVFKKGDVLYGKLRPYLNKHDVANYDGICSTDILVFRNPNEESAKFFNYYLSLNSTISQAHEDSSGINLPRISSKKLGEFNIPIPPLSEQQRIVAKLDALFGHLDVIEGKIERIKDYKLRLIESSLVDKETGRYFQTKELKSFIEEGTERIGADWPNKFKVGVSAKQGVIELATGQKLSFDKYKIVRPGDFVYNAMRVNIGSIIQYESNEIGITSPDYIVFRIKHTLSAKLLLNWLKSENGILQINTKGSVRSRLYFKNLSNINYPIAPREIQSKAESILIWFEKLENNWVKKLDQKVLNIKQSILNKAFKGELVRQEVKEYQVEEGERLMAAEDLGKYKN